jgi:uncharacterized membrane protein YhiD involved in acid resistance
MEKFMELLNVTDLTNEFLIVDIVMVMVLSFLLSVFIGWIYKITHRGGSYTQSFVFTLVMNGMIVALVMLIVGSDIARAFSLVGALSIVRFRNAIKETRDVGFIFFTMVIGMAVGTRFYLLSVIGAVVISLITLLMTRMDWFAQEISNHILSIQVPNEVEFDTVFDRVFLKYTKESELISVSSVHNGALSELTYSVSMKRKDKNHEFISEIKKVIGNNKVTLIAGYNGTDL